MKKISIIISIIWQSSYAVLRNGYFYFIGFSAPDDKNPQEKFKYELNILDKMVSTFKFTK